MQGTCGNCGGGMSTGAHGAMTCGGCGFSACGGCGMMMPPGRPTCGSCGWSLGHPRQASITDDVAAYAANKAALEHLEASGQGDGAMAAAAEAGMRTAQFKIVAGIVGVVVVLIIFLVVLSTMHSNGPSGVGVPHHVVMAAPSLSRIVVGP